LKERSTKMASRSLDDLHPDLRPVCLAWLKEAQNQNLNPLIVCTYRSAAEQNELYKLGRTKKSHVGVTARRPLGKVVTKAKGGQSAHNFEINGKPASRAFDFVPLVGGKPQWDDSHPHWDKLGKIGQKLGLVWYGAPKAEFFEKGHFQLP